MSPALSQPDAGGRLRHLVTLDGLSRSLVEELLERAESLRAVARPRRRARGADGREHLRRALDPHAHLLRARGDPAGRERRQSRHHALFARQGRDIARHRLHAARHARRRVRHPRRRAGHAGRSRARRGWRGRGRVRRRSAPVAPDPGPARRADHPPVQGRLRRAQGRDRRRHRALACRPLRAPRALDARRRPTSASSHRLR